MAKKVFILSGSPRKYGNSDRMAEAFMNGAKDQGLEVKKVQLADKSIQGCKGCMVCQNNGGKCVQIDEMEEIYEGFMEADIIVLACPVYYYTWNGQMKSVLDRTFAKNLELKNKTFYFLGAGMAENEEYMKTMIDSFYFYVNCFRAGGNTVGDYIFAYQTDKPGDVEKTPALEQSYVLGKSC